MSRAIWGWWTHLYRATLVRAGSVVLATAVGLTAPHVTAGPVNVTTAQNDIARTGQNLLETTLTTSNVNAANFGLLFSQAVSGPVYAQPLYLSGLTVNGAVHDVVFVATLSGAVYAFDANSNSGVNSNPLWSISLLDTTHGASPGATNYGTQGTTGTPVIDPLSGLLYIVSASMENGNPIFRLHALNVLSGAETLGGPVVIAPTVAGSAPDAVNGMVTLNPRDQKQRAGLLLLNGIVYVGFSSLSEAQLSEWHGWVVAFNASTLAQSGVFCTSPNGSGGGVWMAGNGLAADQPDPVNHPYGRMFIATGNGDYTAALPYSSNMDYGDSVLNLDLTNGMPSVTDTFAPSNQVSLGKTDGDLGSGGALVLPTQTSGAHPNLLVQTGKAGTLFLLDRDALGGYSPSGDQVVQELPLAVGKPGPQANAGGWSSPTYWNGNVYYWGVYDHLKQFSLTDGLLATTPTQSAELSAYPGATSSISADGNTQGIVWTIDTDNYPSGGPAILEAHDASNVATTLYSSATVADRDTAGSAVHFSVPTIANGMVYVGTTNQLNVYGLLSNGTQTSRPVISPGSSSFAGTINVTITDDTPNAAIYYTTDGTPATTASTLYSAPFVVMANETLNAVAVAPGLSLSNQTSVKYTRKTAASPLFSPVPLAYSGVLPVSISDSTTGSVIYYTTDGTQPTISSSPYTGPISLNASATIKALAVAPGYSNSGVSSATYTITDASTILVNAASGFVSATGLNLLGNAVVTNNTLQLSAASGGIQDNAAWFTTPVNVQSFTTDFYFQVTAAFGYGFTFTLQNSPAGLDALGSGGAGLGYQGIMSSVAVKFEFFDTSGQGTNSTGFYVNGAAPTVPSIDLTGSGVNLHSTSSDILHAHVTYDGSMLTLILTDTVTGLSFTTSKAIDIPGTVGSSLAYAGFTASTNPKSATQAILNWTYVAAGGAVVSTPTFMPPKGTYAGPQSVRIMDATSGATIYYTTNGTPPTTSSAVYAGPIAVSANETLKAIAAVNGLSNSAIGTAAYLIQTPAPTFAPVAGTYPVTQSVTISDTAGATIYYTTNGSAPTTSSTVYSGPITVSANQTLKAIAVASGFATSAVASANYKIAAPTPGFTPAPGTYSGPQSVTISDAASNATIYYTTNGATPNTSSTLYAGPITVSANQTLKAIAVATGFATSAVASAPYKITAPTPIFTPGAGTYPSGQSVTISDAANDATIYYTTNGTAPTTSSTAYGGPITVSTNQTLKAIAVTSGFATSAVASAVYKIAAPTPTFTPAAGTYTGAQSVTISDSAGDAVIYYTTDKTVPTKSSTVYAGPITVSTNETVKAIAVVSGYQTSGVGAAAYKIK